jgi:hypothetical protein
VSKLSGGEAKRRPRKLEGRRTQEVADSPAEVRGKDSEKSSEKMLEKVEAASSLKVSDR